MAWQALARWPQELLHCAVQLTVLLHELMIWVFRPLSAMPASLQYRGEARFVFRVFVRASYDK